VANSAFSPHTKRAACVLLAADADAFALTDRVER